jgi:hypothetical protein
MPVFASNGKVATSRGSVKQAYLANYHGTDHHNSGQTVPGVIYTIRSKFGEVRMRGRYTDNLDDNNTMHFRVTIRAINSEQSRVVYILPNEDDQILTRMTIARNMLHELEKLCKDKDEDEEMSLSLEMMCE